MQPALDIVVELLDLEAIEVNIFRGLSPDDAGQRIFGGQVAGQALVAAARTVSQGAVHSLHSYFLRPGDPQVPVLYQVDRIRERWRSHWEGMPYPGMTVRTEQEEAYDLMAELAGIQDD